MSVRDMDLRRSDPRKQFRAPWLAAFLGVVLIIGVVFWAMIAFGQG